MRYDPNGLFPVVPRADLFDRLEARVAVVPNPYKANDDIHTYLRTDILRFINLPGRCLIDIYNASGQRVARASKDDLLSGEYRYFQATEPGNLITLNPGIFF